MRIKVKRNCGRVTDRGEEAWSVIHGPMYKNRIRGVADQGEQATNCKALMVNGRGRKSAGRVEKGGVLTWGDLALRLKGRRDQLAQKTGQQVLPFAVMGETQSGERSEEEQKRTQATEHTARRSLMEEVVSPPNLRAALKRVKRNTGSPGVDGMSVAELPAYLAENWRKHREQLLTGKYQPQPVKRQVILKSGGGERELGIPTVLDRFIQQAVLARVLTKRRKLLEGTCRKDAA